MTRPHVMTPARQAALRKAQLASAAARRGRRIAKVSSRVPQVPRPEGVKGLRANFIPYARINKRSATVGYNAGTRIPGSSKRVVTGQYVRIESISKKTKLDRVVDQTVGHVFPKGTRRGKALSSFRSHVEVSTVAKTRVPYKGAQFRLGTSRGVGPTVIVRRGKHKVPVQKSVVGIKKYDRRMSAIAGQKTAVSTPRRQRRKAARKKS